MRDKIMINRKKKEQKYKYWKAKTFVIIQSI